MLERHKEGESAHFTVACNVDVLVGDRFEPAGQAFARLNLFGKAEAQRPVRMDLLHQRASNTESGER